MKIVYIDPGLSSRKGHNAAMLEEFDHALVAQRGHRVSYLCTANTDRSAFDDLHGALIPTFRIDGYARPSTTDLADTRRAEAIASVISADLDSAGVLSDCDAILMPTAYPLHLHALARRGEALGGRRVVLGMLLPSSFWGGEGDDERRIGEMFAHSIDRLNRDADLFAYSETGTFRFSGHPVSLATLLPPLAGPSARHVQRLADSKRSGSGESPVIGFFGSPFTSKGFALLVDAAATLARSGTQPAARIMLRLPAGHEECCRQLNALAPWIDAVSRQTSNLEFLQQMSAADAVLAFYSPQEYGAKMSGIVPEAISLGKPLLIAEGCHAIQDFLERHAPGSFLCGGYDTQTLANVLMLPAAAWSRPARCASRHAPLMQQLKSMERYLAVCGLG